MLNGLPVCQTEDGDLKGCLRSSGNQIRELDDGSEDNSNNAGVIAGIVIGSLALFGLLVMAIVYIVKRHRNNRALKFKKFIDSSILPSDIPNVENVTVSNGKTIEFEK